MSYFISYHELKDTDFVQYLYSIDEFSLCPKKMDDYEELLEDVYDLRCDLFWSVIATVQENESEMYARVIKRFNKDDMDDIEMSLLLDADDLLFDSRDKFKCEDGYSEYVYKAYSAKLYELDSK